MAHVLTRPDTAAYFVNERPTRALGSPLRKMYYDITPMTEEFFERYFSDDATKSSQAFANAVKRYQAEAIRLFSTFGQAYVKLNEHGRLSDYRHPLQERSLDHYRNRRPWPRGRDRRSGTPL